MREIQPAAEKKVEIREIPLPIAKETGKPVSVDTPAPEKKPEIKKVEKKDTRPDGFVRYEFGAELPVYLL